jgi:hypothetical protein
MAISSLALLRLLEQGSHLAILEWARQQRG